MVATLYSRCVCFVVVCALVWSTKGAATGRTSRRSPLDHGPSHSLGGKATRILEDILGFMKSQSCGGVCCPVPYTNVLGECFYLSEQSSTWWQAREHCQGIKGDLAVPKHQFALKDFIYRKAGSLEVFVGGQDEFKNRNFKWLDGTPFKENDWAPGEPNNVEDKEFCAGFYSVKQPMLIDMVCSNTLRFVCQYHFPE
ncbi:C-type lectin-like [Procambarus clarkii]|uniref:C-type lectin-like n=1 Tax=Procambarus clarkii TaxID=6728 RepID=UPI00374493D2